MTGFGRGEVSDEDFTLTVEIKSVNHRYRDIRWRMSSIFNSIEMELKNQLVSNFKRGSFDISVNYKKAEGASKIDDLDMEKIEDFIKLMKEASEKSGVAINFSPTDFLRNEFFVERDEKQEEKMQNLAKKAFSLAIESLRESRRSEGQKMQSVLLSHRNEYVKHFQKIKDKTDTFQKNVEEKLKKRFAEYADQVKVEESRFLQEIVFYLEKIDVHEEINRIEGHLEKLDQLLSQSGEVGRQIDFLIQELNRETNTIGSKSSSGETSDAVVNMKVQLEKIREQGLNIE